MSVQAEPVPDQGEPVERWREYAAGSGEPHFSWFCSRYCIQSIGDWDGRPLALERWQREFFGEVMAVEEDGSPYWRTVVLIMPRKNSKTTMLSAMGLYRLLMDEGRPTILLAASSDGQAKHLFDAAASFILRSPEVSSEVMTRDYLGEITRNDGAGVIRRVASDYRRLHGQNPSLVLADEIAFWTTPTLRKAWAALTTAGGARSSSQVIGISTAGEIIHRHDSIVGSMLDAGIAAGDIEGDLPGLRMIRDHRSRTLIYEYAAVMPDADPQPVRDLLSDLYRLQREEAPEERVQDALAAYEEERERVYRVWKSANPASWIGWDQLTQPATDPALPREDALQLHACVWTESEGQWITPADWDALEVDDRLQPGDLITLGFDGSETDDSTVLIASRVSDGLIQPIGIWSKPEGARYWHVPRDEVSAAVEEAFREYHVAIMLADRPFWQSEIDRWAGDYPGRVMEFRTANVPKMTAAIERFATDAASGLVIHSGDREVARHVVNAQRVRAGTGGGWRLSKPASDFSRKIDAAVGAILAWEGRAHAIERGIDPRPRTGTLITF